MNKSTNQIYRKDQSVGLALGTATIALFLVASQMMLGVRAVDSLGIFLIFGLYSVAGAVIWQGVTKKRAETLFHLIGFGFPIGATLSAGFVLATRSVGITTVPTAVLALCIPAISIFALFVRSTSIRPTNANTQIHELLIIGLCPLVYLSSWSKYTLISLVIISLLVALGQLSFLFFDLERSTMTEWITFFFVCIPVLSAVAINNLLNPFDSSLLNLAQTAGADVIHDAAQSFGYGQYGFQDFVGQAGNARNGYPLAFVVTGMFADILNMPRLLVAATSIQIIATLALASVFVSIVRYFLAPQISMNLLMILLFAQASYPSPFLTGEYAKINNILGLTLFLIAIFLVLVSFQTVDLQLHVTAFGLFILTILTKPHHALTLLILVWGLTSTMMVTKNKFGGVKLRIFISFSMTIAYYLASITILQVDGARVPLVISVSKYWLLIGLSLMIGRGLICYLGRDKKLETDFVYNFRISSLICFFSSICLTILLDGSNNMNYTISASLVLVALANAGIIEAAFEEIFSARSIRILVIVSLTFFSGFVIYVSFAVINLHIIRSGHNTLLRFVFGEEVPMISIVTLVILCVFALVMLKNTIIHQGLFHFVKSMAIAISIVLNFGFFVGNLLVSPIKLSVYGLSESRNDFIRADNIAAAIWLEKNSDVNDIIATNTLCRGSVTVGSATPGTLGSLNQSSECFERNTNMFVSAIASRRMLIEAPIFGPSGFTLDFETARRYNLIHDLSSNPNALTIKTLKDYGVSWLLIDKTLSNFTDWQSLASLQFSKGETIVLSI